MHTLRERPISIGLAIGLFASPITEIQVKRSRNAGCVLVPIQGGRSEAFALAIAGIACQMSSCVLGS